MHNMYYMKLQQLLMQSRQLCMPIIYYMPVVLFE